MAHALTAGQPCQNHNDHFGLRKGGWVMGRRADKVGKKATLRKFTDYRPRLKAK